MEQQSSSNTAHVTAVSLVPCVAGWYNCAVVPVRVESWKEGHNHLVSWRINYLLLTSGRTLEKKGPGGVGVMSFTCPLSSGGGAPPTAATGKHQPLVLNVDVTAITTPCMCVCYVYEFYLQHNLYRGLHRHKEAFAPHPEAWQSFCLFLRSQGRGCLLTEPC